MKSILPSLLLMLLAFTGSAQTVIEGVSFPGRLGTDKSPLVLNGGGVREKYFMDMYIVALYLREKSSDAEKIISADEPMLIRLHIVSGLITSEKMIEAVENGFRKSSGDQVPQLRERIEKFIDLYREEIKKGDVFDLMYVPGKGTAILKNGTLKAVIEGLDFKKGLFGIWLCNDPADETLKLQMLGKK